MAITEARHRANEKYNAKAYDAIPVRVQKGKKEVIQQYAADAGESLNGYITRAIDMRMNAPGGYGISAAAPGNMDISRFISHAVIERISAVLPEGETMEDYLRTAVLEKLERDESSK